MLDIDSVLAIVEVHWTHFVEIGYVLFCDLASLQTTLYGCTETVDKPYESCCSMRLEYHLTVGLLTIYDAFPLMSFKTSLGTLIDCSLVKFWTQYGNYPTVVLCHFQPKLMIYSTLDQSPSRVELRSFSTNVYCHFEHKLSWAFWNRLLIFWTSSDVKADCSLRKFRSNQNGRRPKFKVILDQTCRMAMKWYGVFEHYMSYSRIFKMLIWI